MQNFDNEKEPLTKPTKGGMALNQTNDVNESSLPDLHNAGGDDEKRKKMIKYGIIGGIAVVLITVTVVLIIVLGKGSKPGPGPGPGPGPVF
jgi:hypothetical protein